MAFLRVISPAILNVIYDVDRDFEECSNTFNFDSFRKLSSDFKHQPFRQRTTAYDLLDEMLWVFAFHR